MDDPFLNLGREINRTVQKVLDSKTLEDLGSTIQDTVRRTTQKVADTAKKAADSAQWTAGNPQPPAGHTSEPRGAEHAGGAPAGEPKPSYSYYQAASRPASSYPAAGYASPRKTRAPGRASSVCMIVLGFLGAIPLGIFALIFWLLALLNTLRALFLTPALVLTVLALAFAVLIFAGFAKYRRSQRFVQYQAVIQGRSFCPVSEFSAATGRDGAFIVKDLLKMVRARMFAEGYFDAKKTCFFLDYATFQQYQQMEERHRQQAEEQRRQKEKRDSDPEQAALHQMRTEGNAYLTKIRESNDALPEEDISLKLDALEDITGKILDYVEKHPEKLPQIRKFLCYYLPTTLKLVEAYRDLERQPSSAEGAAETKEEIREAIGKINLAFQQLLSNLMQDDLLDLSADISALETMFAQEGLTGKPLRPGGK